MLAAQRGSAASIARGARLFGENCAICHPNMTRSASSDLRRMSGETHARFNEIVLQGLMRAGGMPSWGDVLTQADAEALHAYLIDLSQRAYAAQASPRTAPRTSPGGLVPPASHASSRAIESSAVGHGQ
jgi:quinohemoprotein ethanol dehydrogenase